MSKESKSMKEYLESSRKEALITMFVVGRGSTGDVMRAGRALESNGTIQCKTAPERDVRWSKYGKTTWRTGGTYSWLDFYDRIGSHLHHWVKKGCIKKVKNGRKAVYFITKKGKKEVKRLENYIKLLFQSA